MEITIINQDSVDSKNIYKNSYYNRDNCENI